VEKKRADSFYEALRKTLEEGQYDREDALIGRLLDQGFVATDIAAALLHLYGTEKSPEPARETRELRDHRDERPAPGNRDRDFSPAPAVFHSEKPERRPPAAGTGLKANRESGEFSHEEGMSRLILGVGRDHGVQPGDVLGVIVGVTKISKESVGVIRLQPKQAFVDIADEHADFVVSKINGIEFKGRKLWCKRATVAKVAKSLPAE
jgi:ATP-dependent RNA helicase DeaD